MKRRSRNRPSYAQVIVLLITGEGALGFVSRNSVDRAVVVPKFCQPRLDRADNSVATLSWGSIAAVVTIWVLSVILIAAVGIVIVAVGIVVGIRGIGAVSVVRIVIPRISV